MSRHVRPLIKRDFGRIVTETPFNAAWVDAIKTIIPQNYRKFEGGGCWSFDVAYYTCVLEITKHYFGLGIIDSTGGVAHPQGDSWKERWNAYKELDRNAHKDEQQYKREPQRPQPKASSSAYSTLFVTENAPKQVIIAAHRALSAMHHPDVGGDHETMARINSAFQELKKKGKV